MGKLHTLTILSFQQFSFLSSDRVFGHTQGLFDEARLPSRLEKVIAVEERVRWWVVVTSVIYGACLQPRTSTKATVRYLILAGQPWYSWQHGLRSWSQLGVDRGIQKAAVVLHTHLYLWWQHVRARVYTLCVWSDALVGSIAVAVIFWRDGALGGWLWKVMRVLLNIVQVLLLAQRIVERSHHTAVKSAVNLIGAQLGIKGVVRRLHISRLHDWLAPLLHRTAPNIQGRAGVVSFLIDTYNAESSLFL